MEKENKLAVIVSESGLDKTKAQVLLENFSNYFDIAADWENKAKMLVVTDVTQVAEMKMADEGRKFLKQKRIDVEKTRKVLKENALREGQTIDSIARILTNLITPIEDDLEQKAKFREIKEAEAKEARKQERIKLLEPFGELHDAYMIGEMSEDGFKNYYEGLKLNHERRIAEEKAAEEKRLAEIEAERKRQEAIKAENEKLRKEAEEKQKELEAEREKVKKDNETRQRIESERERLREKRRNELRPYIIFIRDYEKMISLDENNYQKEFIDIQRAAKEHYEYEAKERQKQLDEKNKLFKKMEAERKEKEKAEAQLKARQEAERKAREKAEAEKKVQIEAEKKAARAPDKIKIVTLSETIRAIVLPEVKSQEAKEIIGNTKTLLQKVVNYLTEKSNNL